MARFSDENGYGILLPIGQSDVSYIVDPDQPAAGIRIAGTRLVGYNGICGEQGRSYAVGSGLALLQSEAEKVEGGSLELRIMEEGVHQ